MWVTSETSEGKLLPQPLMYLLNVKQPNGSFPAAEGSQNGALAVATQSQVVLTWMDEQPGHSL